MNLSTTTKWRNDVAHGSRIPTTQSVPTWRRTGTSTTHDCAKFLPRTIGLVGVSFFLTAVRLQAEDNESKVRIILKLYEDSKSRVIALTHSQHAIHALDYIFDQPIFNSTNFKNGSGIPDSTARRILTLFIEDGILKVAREQSGKRSRVLVFPELLNITEGKTIF